MSRNNKHSLINKTNTKNKNTFFSISKKKNDLPNCLTEDSVLSTIYKDLKKTEMHMNTHIQDSIHNRWNYNKHLRVLSTDTTMKVNLNQKYDIQPKKHTTPILLTKNDAESKSRSKGKKTFTQFTTFSDNGAKLQQSALKKQSSPHFTALLFHRKIDDLPKSTRSLLLPLKKEHRQKISHIPYSRQWYKKNKIPVVGYSLSLINEKMFQNNYFNDQFIILFDNIQKYKSIYLGKHDLIKILASKPSSLLKYNIMLEETIVLMNQSIQELLMEFYSSIDKYLTIIPPNFKRFCNRKVTDEEKELVVNVKFFNEMNTFAQGGAKVYDHIMKQTEDFILPKDTFPLVKQYLDRCRMTVSQLIFYSKNIYKDYYIDSDLVEDYQNNIREETDSWNSDDRGYSSYVKNVKILKHVQKDHYLSPKELGYSDNFERVKRLKEIFQDKAKYEERRQLKKRVKSRLANQFSLESPLISNILAFCSKEWRAKVISERVIRRFKEKENYKID